MKNAQSSDNHVNLSTFKRALSIQIYEKFLSKLQIIRNLQQFITHSEQLNNIHPIDFFYKKLLRIVFFRSQNWNIIVNPTCILRQTHQY